MDDDFFGSTLVECLQHRSVADGACTAFLFLSSGDEVTDRYTFSDLDQRARAIAAELTRHTQRGDRVLLLQPQGLEFLACFFGAMYAGLIPVPAYPPANRRHVARIETILKDAEASAILTTSVVGNKVRDWLEYPARAVLDSDVIPSAAVGGFQPIKVDPIDIAFLQYTSGSTTAPRGVMITHANLVANLRMMKRAFGYASGTRVATWLPIFHDMGLIGNLLPTVAWKLEAHFMPPVAFLQKPLRWLKLLSDQRIEYTGGPNFSFAQCVDKITDEQRDALDLSSVKWFFCGAEPIRAQVIQAFLHRFESCGLRRNTFYPCYGMAETTLMVTGPQAGSPLRSFRALKNDLLRGRGVEDEASSDVLPLIGCGHSVEGQVLRIVDSESRMPVSDGTIGEIWVKGPHVAAGYWNRPEDSFRTFGACIMGAEADGTFLRTGDLGFYLNDHLYITGRLKELIIIRGRNYYPQDLEYVAVKAVADLESGAAFSVEENGSERLVLVFELKRTALKSVDGPALAEAIRRAVSEEFEIQPHTIVLIRPASLPKTSSGKIQRRSCREIFLKNDLEEVYRWNSQTAAAASAPQKVVSVSEDIQPQKNGGNEIQSSASRCDKLIHWLRGYAENRINSRLMDERRSIPPYIVLDFGNQGLLGLMAPLAVGGLDLRHCDIFRVVEQLGAIDLNLLSFVGVHNALGVRPVIRFGSTTQHRDILPRIAQGRELISFAYTEPGAGSNPRAIVSTARPDGPDRWRLSGEKKFIGSAAWSGYLNTFVHLVDENGRHRGITAFILRQGTEGLVQGPEELTMGVRGMVQNTVFLRNVSVGSGELLGDAGHAMPIAHDMMKFGRLCIAGGSLGAMKRCAQLMLRYAGRREISTGLLLDNYLTRVRISELLTRTRALELFMGEFARWLDEALEVPEEFYAAVKVAGPETAARSIDHLVQMMGGRGFVESNLAPQMLRDIRLYRIFEGPTETMATFIGLRLLQGGQLFYPFLEGKLKCPEIAKILRETTLAVQSRLGLHPRDEGGSAHQNGCLLLADAGIYGAWLAAVRSAQRLQSSRTRGEAFIWLERAFENAIQKARSASSEEPSPLSSSMIEEEVERLKETIGDVDQHAPDELRECDPLLRRKVTFIQKSHSNQEKSALQINTKSAPPKDDLKLESWIQEWISKRLRRPVEQIQAEAPFADFGLDSISAVELSADLSCRIGRELPATITWDYPNIHALAVYLSESSQAEAPVPKAAVSSSAESDFDNFSEEELANMLRAELETNSLVSDRGNS